MRCERWQGWSARLCPGWLVWFGCVVCAGCRAGCAVGGCWGWCRWAGGVAEAWLPGRDGSLVVMAAMFFPAVSGVGLGCFPEGGRLLGWVMSPVAGVLLCLGGDGGCVVGVGG